jgi:hypothetical protein
MVQTVWDPSFQVRLVLENTQDTDQLRLLSIFHYVVAGLGGLVSLVPLLHVAIGIGIVSGAFDNSMPGQSPPAFLGWVFILVPLVIIVTGLTVSLCIFVAGQKLSRRTGHLYCLVIAGVECAFMPFGTVLGILTILVLTRPSVKILFGVPGSGERSAQNREIGL